MKKKLLFCMIIAGCFFLTGCFKKDEKDVVKELTKKIEGTKGYHLTGDLEIVNNEETYRYSVDVSSTKNEQFRVSLKNKTNNHEQIILKNSEGVYVLTPSLNKSFKFQSEWPYNNSQSYLLQTLLQDIKNDSERVYQETDNGYEFTTKVTYSSNKELVKQIIKLDKDLNIEEVNVINESGGTQIKMVFTNIDMKANFDDKYFELAEKMETASIEEETKTVGKIEDIIYPMYIPENTRLTSQDTVETDNGERVILTFSGEKSFLIVQETSPKSTSLTTVPIYGDPLFVGDSIGAMTDSSVTWMSDGIEYYVVSDNLNQEELLNVVNSVSSIPIGK